MENRNRILISLMIIAMTAALIGGGTMAWFTAKAELGNEFTAGTVMIDLDSEVADGYEFENVNPGDCYDIDLELKYNGTKDALLRIKVEEEWEFDWQYIEDNWEALCFTDDENKPDGWISDWTEEDVQGEDFQNWVKGLENPERFDGESLEDLLDGFIKEGDFWYYNGVIGGVDEGESTLILSYDEICFDGPTMNNFYQAAKYKLDFRFEAIQASNNASGDAWGVDSVYDPEDPQSGANWSSFDFDD